MVAFSSTPSTRRCATDRHCGPRDGFDFSGVARACLERYENADVSDSHPARGIRARIASARLSLSALAIRPGLRLSARQPSSWLRRAEDPPRVLYALPGSFWYI